MKRCIKRIVDEVKKYKILPTRKLLMVVGIIVLVVVVSRISLSNPQQKLVTEGGKYEFPSARDKRKATDVMFNDVSVRAVIADTTTERSIGLSGYEALNKDQAMLFVFDTLDYHSFWMRDMNFSIDIIWLDENKEVVFIKESAEPQDFPESYKSPAKALYVLEVYDGFVVDEKVQIESTFSWK